MSIFQDPQSGEWYQGPDRGGDPFGADEEESLRLRGIVRDPQSGDFYQVPQSSIPHWRRPEPVMAPQAPAEPTLEEGVGLADYAKSVMAGGAQLGQATGWLMRQLGAEDMGSAIETLGRDAVDYWNEGLSDAAKDALSREFVSKNEAGEWEWGDANLHTVGLFGAQSLLGSLGGAGAGAGITKVLQTFANPVGRSALLRAAQAGSDQALKKLALVDKVIGAAGFATGEGLVGGASAGVNVYDRIMSMDPAKITENPRYRQVYESTDETMPELERHQYAAETVAREASSLAGLQSGLTTALLGAPMGAFFGSMFGKSSIGKLAQGRAARAATGAGGEAAQEFAQGGAEAAISNVAVRDAGDTDVDVWDDVLNQALGGALAGAPIGGALGLAEQPEQVRTPSLDEMQEKFPPAREMLALPAPRGEADFTVGPDGEAIPRGQIRPERPALPAPGANADFTVTSDGETIPRGEARTTPPDPMQQWARDSRAMRAGINADQATRQQQEAEALGQSPAAKWKPETIERVKAAATEAVQAGADREAVLEAVRTAASGKIAPVVAMRRMAQLRTEASGRQALPGPRPANAFEVDPEGQARQLTEAEARQANDRVAGAQQARVDMGTAPTKAPGLGGKREQVVQAGWKADTIKRVRAAADAAVEAGVPREVADGVLARMNKGEVKPLVAARQLKQLQNAQTQQTQGEATQATAVEQTTEAVNIVPHGGSGQKVGRGTSQPVPVREMAQPLEGSGQDQAGELLPRVPRGVHAGASTEAPRTAGASATPSERTSLRERVPEPRVAGPDAVRKMRGTGGAGPDAPRGLQQTAGGAVAVSRVSDDRGVSEANGGADLGAGKRPLLRRGERRQRIGLLPRDMREDLFNQHATFNDPEAKQADFNMQRVPRRKLRIDNIEGLDEINPEQLEKYGDPTKLPPVVIADGRLIDGQHRIGQAKRRGITELDAIDVSGLIDTEEAGYITELPADSTPKRDSGSHTAYAGARHEADPGTSRAAGKDVPNAETSRLLNRGGVRGGQGVPAPTVGAGNARRPLAGLPAKQKVAGRGEVTFGPFEPAHEAAEQYARDNGIDYQPLTTYAKVNKVRAARIASAYDAMPHAPNDPQVKASYDAMIAETLAQYQAIKATGLKIEAIEPGQVDPYAATPRLAILDVVENNHLWFFPTDSGFGGPNATLDVSGNPLLALTDEYLGERQLRANDVFRIVHDYFGHIKDGAGFRAEGEENAWRSHARMYSPLARGAMTTETRGQNSWLNFGPYAEYNKTANAAETEYAPQKTGLLPREFWEMDEEGDAPLLSRAQTSTPEFRRWFGNSKVVDENGQPQRVYHGTAADFDTFDPAKLKAEGAFFFVDRPFAASEYATATGRNKGATPNVMSVFLSLQNPLVVDGSALKNDMSYDRIVRKAKREGHDGLIVRGIQDTPYPDPWAAEVDVFVAFEPTQIKSATGNSGAFNPDDPSILKRQGQVRPAVQQALDRVQAELKDFVAGIGALVNVQIHATAADMQAATGMEIPDDTKGAWLPGTNTVHIVAENHAPGEAITTAVHETVGHLAIFRYEDGRRAVDSVTRQIRQGAAWTKPYVKDIQSRYGTLTDTELAAEVIALMAERGEQNLTLTKLIAGIRRFLRKLGVKMEFSDADIRDLIARSARALKQEAAQLRPKLAALTPAATDQQILDAIEEQFPANVVALDAYMALRSARERATGELAEQLDAEIAALEGRKPEGSTLHLKKPLRSADATIELERKRYPIRDANGKLVAETPEQQRNFWRWFRGSKVMDPRARPIVMYHGARAKFDSFSHAHAPHDIGFHFGTEEQADYRVGDDGQVLPFYLAIKNPLRVRDQGGWTTEAAIEEINRASGLKIRAGARGREIRAALQTAGFDGIVYENRFEGEKGGDSYIAFQPEQIKAAAGNAGSFDPSNPRFLFRRGAAAADPKVQAILDRVMIKPPEAMTMRDRARELWHKITDTSSLQLKQGFIDSFASIEALERNANNGALKDAADSAYKAALATKNLSSVMAGVMLKGVPQFANGAYVPVAGRRGIVDIFNPLTQHKDGNLLSQWEGYAAARRASRLIKEQNVDGSSRENLFTQDEIDTLLTLGKKYPEFDQVFNEWQAFNKQVLDLAQEAGVIDPTTRVLWERNDYVPFYRVAEELGSKTGPSNKAGLANQSSGIRQLKGGEAQLGNVFENMMMNTAHLIDASFKNRAMQRIVDLGAGTALDKVDLDWEAVKFNDAQLAAALRKAGIEVESMDKAQREHWSTLFRRIAPKGPNIVSVMKAGKPEYYEVTDPLVLQSIAGLGYDNFADVFGLFRGSKKLLTNAITADPAFMMANFVRDTLSNWVISDASTKPMVDAVKALGATLKDDPDLVQLMMAGAGGGGFYDSAPEDIRKLIASRVPANQQRAFLDSVVGPKNVWRLWRKIGAAAENANRIATFRAVLAAGGSVAEAAYQARDVLNFSMAGNFGAMRWLTQSVPFLNARVQGLYRLYRGARDNKRGFFMKGAMLTAATMALALANEDDDEYEELPEWDKDTYWHLFVGGEHWRIPKPFEVGALFSTIPERLYRTAAGRDSTSLLADRMFQMFADTFAFNPVPQLVKPVIEQYANRSMFTGSPIVGMAEQPLQPEAQFTPWTSETMQELAKAMPDFAPAWLRSPKRLEAALRAYTGAIGMYVLGISDQAVRGALGYPEEPSRKVYDLPVVSRFWKDPDPRHTKYADQLYEMMDEANAISSTINRYTRERRFGEAAELRSENKSKLAVRVRLNRLGTQVRNINHQIRLIQLDATMDPDTKRTRIDALVDRKNDTTREVARYADIF